MSRHSLLAATFIAMSLLLLASCQCHDTTASQQQNVSVSLNLPSATVNVSGQLKFTATVTGTTDTGVTWYVNDIAGGNSTVGTIGANGLYTAPVGVPSPASVTVKATSNADPTKSATSTVTVQASAGFLPVTGQTASYATGDDGDLKKGAAWPNPRFTVGTGEEADCVRDNLTGLMWLRNPDSTKRSWADALAYADGLVLCGYDDWRLSNRKELWSLIDRSKVRPPLPDGNPFTNIQSDYYWTSTSWEYNNPSTNAWHFGMAIGDTGGGSDKTIPRYAWPVRSGQIGAVAVPQTGQTTSYATGDDGDLQTGAVWPNPRFVAGTGLEADCITDNLTGLMWVKNPDQVQRTWQQAVDYANGLSLCGYDDWRLPNINDLESVEHLGVPNASDWLIAQGFTTLVSPAGCTYWSSTTYADNTELAWRIGLCSSNVSVWAKTESWYAWPVRTPVQNNIVLNSVPLHLGDNIGQAPLYGSEFSGSGSVTGTFSSAILSVRFMGEIGWPISSPTTTISGVDIGPFSQQNPYPTGVEVFFNGTKVGLAPSDFPNIPGCISEFNEYICPFEFTVDVTASVLMGQNEVIVRCTAQTGLDDFVIDNVVIRFQ